MATVAAAIQRFKEKKSAFHIPGPDICEWAWRKGRRDKFSQFQMDTEMQLCNLIHAKAYCELFLLNLTKQWSGFCSK